MFTHVYLEETGHGRLRNEEKLVTSECERLGIPVTLYTKKRIQRRQLPLAVGVFICGDVDSMHRAMKQMDIPIPAPHDYPKSLTPWYGRRVWKTTLSEITHHFHEGNALEVFVKPASRQKYFTGRVFTSSEDLHAVAHVSQREEVWCSEVVTWRTEYRAYVVGEEIVSLDHYMGSATITPCVKTIQEALMAYRHSGEAPAAYGIDFGVLESGETALVEANDGYALGAYQIGAKDYCRVLFTRWQELSQLATIQA